MTASRIKGITVEIGGDTTKLQTALSWMPDFMQGLADGINKSKGVIQKAVKGVAGDMVINPNVRATSFALPDGGSVSGFDSESLVATIKDNLEMGGNTELDVAIDSLKEASEVKELTRKQVKALVKGVVVMGPEHIEIKWNFSEEVLRFITEE